MDEVSNGENVLRLVKQCNNGFDIELEDFLINKDLDLSSGSLADNVLFLNEGDLSYFSGFTCRIALSIWKASISENSALHYIHDLEMIDSMPLYLVGTSANVFYCDGEFVYKRSSSFEVVKIGKGSIEYDAERECAILTLRF